ncbi:type II toxin-antitoxin system HicB family antitoxin [Pontiellaceae bacterium B12219]|nr:type II toxin-antitoxin system HicB family antitoxin [Pontiellaceae bacterium B12219]
MKPLQYNSYVGSVDYSLEDGCLHGKILYINDLVTYEAETVPELEAAFRDSVDDYLETCAEIGKDPDKSFKGTFNVRMTPELHKAAAIEAVLLETTLNDFVSQAVAEKLAGREVHHHNEQHIHLETSVTEPLDFDAMRRGGGYRIEEDVREYEA